MDDLDHHKRRMVYFNILFAIGFFMNVILIAGLEWRLLKNTPINKKLDEYSMEEAAKFDREVCNNPIFVLNAIVLLV